MKNSNNSFILIIIIILVFSMAARTPMDSDMWWHLRAGEETVTSGRPYLVDTLSYTRYGEKWVSHGWLTEALMYILFKAGGFLALSALVAATASISMAILFLHMDGSPLFKAFLIVLGCMIAAPTWAPRPQILSLVLLAITSFILHHFKTKKKDYLWVFVPLFILWSNLHGGYTLGLMLIGVTITGEAINHMLHPAEEPVLKWRQIGKLTLFAILSGCAALINPNGFSTWLVPFKTVVMESNQWITEWSSPDFHQFSQQPFLWMIFLFLAATGWSGKKIDATDLLAFSWFAFLGFMAKRNFGPFAVVSLPIAARYIWCMSQELSKQSPLLRNWISWLDERQRKPGQVESKERFKFRPILNAGMVSVLALTGIVKLIMVTTPISIQTAEELFFPVRAVEYIQQQSPPGNLLNEYSWGGYLTFHLREYPVYIDARADLFGDEIIEEWASIVMAENSWNTALDQYEVNLVLLQPDRPLTRELAWQGWITGYADDMAVVLIRPSQ